MSKCIGFFECVPQRLGWNSEDFLRVIRLMVKSLEAGKNRMTTGQSSWKETGREGLKVRCEV